MLVQGCRSSCRGRQSAAASETRLLKPAAAWRFRWNKNTDTPLPPDEPSAANPPEGAILDYQLASAASSPVVLEIVDDKGEVVRRYSSSDPSIPPADTDNVPYYWIRPPQTLSTAAGSHRFIWDLHYTPAPGAKSSYPIAAVAHNTAPEPTSPWVMPGEYTVRLTVDGKTMTQPLTVRMDPRVKTSPAGLEQQFMISKQLYDGVVAVNRALTELHALRPTLTKELGAKAGELEGEEQDAFEYSFGRPIGSEKETLNSIAASMLGLMHVIQSADVAPTDDMLAAAANRLTSLRDVLARYETYRSTLPAKK